MGLEEEACKQGGVRALSDQEIMKLLRELPGWSLKDRAIEREFRFKDFKGAMEFVNSVAALAEAEDHHPDICISYNKVRLTLSTHKANGLTCKDFILGAKINLAAEAQDE